MKDKKNVFYFSFVIVATTVMFMNFDVDATESNQSAVVSNLNLSNTAAADAIDMAVRGIATNNIDRLMSETILPVLANSSSSNIVANKNNHTSRSSSRRVTFNQQHRGYFKWSKHQGNANTKRSSCWEYRK